MLTKQQIAELEEIEALDPRPSTLDSIPTLVIVVSPTAQLRLRAMAQAAEIDAALQAARTVRLLRRIRDARAAAAVIDI